jgi:hypothetical protein
MSLLLSNRREGSAMLPSRPWRHAQRYAAGFVMSLILGHYLLRNVMIGIGLGAGGEEC